MLSSTVREARLNLSRLLKLVQAGHEVIIRNRDKPVARLTPYVETETKPFPDLSGLRGSLGKGTREVTPAETLVRQDRDSR